MKKLLLVLGVLFVSSLAIADSTVYIPYSKSVNVVPDNQVLTPSAVALTTLSELKNGYTRTIENRGDRSVWYSIESSTDIIENGLELATSEYRDMPYMGAVYFLTSASTGTIKVEQTKRK